LNQTNYFCCPPNINFKLFVTYIKIFERKLEHIVNKETKSNINIFNNETDNICQLQGKVNINKSTENELKTLPGIGESLSNKIIEYRNKHFFKSIYDITQVPYIKNKKFQQIQNLITI